MGGLFFLLCLLKVGCYGGDFKLFDGFDYVEVYFYVVVGVVLAGFRKFGNIVVVVF